jgi:hypothetical protein
MSHTAGVHEARRRFESKIRHPFLLFVEGKNGLPTDQAPGLLLLLILQFVELLDKTPLLKVKGNNASIF